MRHGGAAAAFGWPLADRLLVVAACIAALAYWPQVQPEPTTALVALKGAGVALLALTAFASASKVEGRMLGLALALGALGDVVIAMPDGFLGGLGAFLAGHLVYMLLLLRLGKRRWLGWRKGLAALMILMALLVYGVIVWAQRSPVAPVLAYMAVLATVAVLAAQRNLPASVALGAALFAVSDALIGLAVFVLPESPWAWFGVEVTPFLIWPLYFTGQLMLFAGLRRAIAAMPPVIHR